MPSPVITPSKHLRILVVDDEPDIHSVTKLSLRGMKYGGRGVKFLNAHSGSEAVELMRSNPDISVILLDVVMETDHAGLDACNAIRGELGNPFVRILLRTGQPGAAPERETIDDYDIDDYLPKTELTTNKLYTAVRTALKAWTQLIELERHRRNLAAIHTCAVGLRPYDPLPDSLSRILEAAVSLCPTELAVLHLETFSTAGDPQRITLHQSTQADPHAAAAAASERVARIARDVEAQSALAALPLDDGWFVPLVLHRELGFGWLHLTSVSPDAMTQQALDMLASHGANALYASVAQRMLETRQGPVFDEMSI